MRIFKLLFFLLIFFSNPLFVKAEEWVITSLDWEPYSSSSMISQGHILQKLRLLLKKENIDLVVEFYPWKRSQYIARGNGYVGYFPAWPEEVDDCCFFPSTPIGWSEIAVMKRNGVDIEFDTLDKLFSQVKVGIIRTYVYPEDIAMAARKYPDNVDLTPNESSLVLKLSKGRFDVAITDPDVMMYMAEKKGIYNVSKLVTITKKELVIAFSKKPENELNAKTIETIIKKTAAINGIAP